MRTKMALGETQFLKTTANKAFLGNRTINQSGQSHSIYHKLNAWKRLAIPGKRNTTKFVSVSAFISFILPLKGKGS